MDVFSDDFATVDVREDCAILCHPKRQSGGTKNSINSQFYGSNESIMTGPGFAKRNEKDSIVHQLDGSTESGMAGVAGFEPTNDGVRGSPGYSSNV